MGGVLESMNPFTYDHWMPDEDPTYYVPASLPLTHAQRVTLAQAGFTQGEPFILSRDGRLRKPESKKYTLRGQYSLFTIKPGSAVLYEEEEGKFSLEFLYFTPLEVKMQVYICAKDISDGDTICFDQYKMHWGPFHLNASPSGESSKFCGNEEFNEDGKVSDEEGNEVCDDYPFKLSGDNAATNSTNSEIRGISNSNSQISDGYIKWSSRKCYACAEKESQSRISALYANAIDLPTISEEGSKIPSLYDIVIFVSPCHNDINRNSNNITSVVNQNREHSNATSSGCATIESARDEVTPRQVDVSQNWLSSSPAGGRGKGSNTKVIPSDIIIQGSKVDSNKNQTGQKCDRNNNSYQLISSTGENLSNRVTREVQLVNVNSSSAARAAGKSQHDNGNNGDSPVWVQKEAFFFRIKYESFEKRHANKSSPSAVPSPSAADVSIGTASIPNSNSTSSFMASNTINQSPNSAANATTIQDAGEVTIARDTSEQITKAHRSVAKRSSIFMRSKPIALECALQLFIVDGRVYNRIGLFGMEGFKYPMRSVRDPAARSGIKARRSSSRRHSKSNEHSRSGEKNKSRLGRIKAGSVETDSESTMVGAGTAGAGAGAVVGAGKIDITGASSKHKSNITAISSGSREPIAPASLHVSPSVQPIPAYHVVTAGPRVASPPEGNGVGDEAGPGEAECIICLTNRQTTIMFPCRHLCLCTQCAAVMATRYNTNANARTGQSKNCPVCRKAVILMFQLKVV